MKFVDADEIVCLTFETEDGTFYRRYSYRNWERLWGESWEPVYNSPDKDVLEEAYLKYCK